MSEDSVKHMQSEGPTAPELDEQVVRMLREMLADAEAGRLTGFAAVLDYGEDVELHRTGSITSETAVVGLEKLKMEILGSDE